MVCAVHLVFSPSFFFKYIIEYYTIYLCFCQGILRFIPFRMRVAEKSLLIPQKNIHAGCEALC